MLNYQQTEALLATQDQAYRLMEWLTREVARRPDLLTPQDAATLHQSDATRRWLDAHSSEIPSKLLFDLNESFVNLFASFFETSFHIKHLEFDGKLLDSNVKVGLEQRKSTAFNPAQCQFLALKHLCNSEDVYLTDKEAKALVKRASLRESLLVWTYVWELDRRARGKGKGAVVHEIWRKLPVDVRKNLNAERVWNDREQLLTVVRELVAQIYR